MRTLEKIKDCFTHSQDPLSANQIAKLAGVSLSEHTFPYGGRAFVDGRTAIQNRRENT